MPERRMLAARLGTGVAPDGYNLEADPSPGSELRVEAGTKIMEAADKSHGAMVPGDMCNSFS
jgi:hypothetical protein